MLWFRARRRNASSIPIQHFAQILVVPGFNFLDFVGGAETIEEMEKWNAAFDGGQVSHSAQIHNFLRTVAAQHGITGLTAGQE